MVRSAVIGHALERTFGAGSVVMHRPNHTGSRKLSFEVLAAGRRLWVRVAADDAEDGALRTWGSMARLLTERHTGPPVLDVIEVAGHTALVFPFLDAAVATRATLLGRYHDVKAVLDRLHDDRDLAERLGAPTTSAAVYREVWIRRFDEDLRIIVDHVTPDVHEYLRAEVQALADLVEGLDEVVHAAMHGDPWHENLLLERDRIWLLDWEDLRVGDPVVDHAILVMDTRGPAAELWPHGRRYDVARRALLLDAAVDTAADWVQSANPATRAWKERAFRQGLAAYRACAARD